MTASPCPWSLRWHPDIDAACDFNGTHREHSAQLPGGVTRVWWQADDPRAWQGTRPGRCTTMPDCALPAHHRGGCQP